MQNGSGTHGYAPGIPEEEENWANIMSDSNAELL